MQHLAGRYYRSFRACKHYVPIWHRSIDDVVDVVKELRKPGALHAVLWVPSHDMHASAFGLAPRRCTSAPCRELLVTVRCLARRE